MYLALAGGVGGARLANGLAQCLEDHELTVVVNVGDDFTHCGLRISPDLDTVMYTLAGRNNEKLGWGLAGETWRSFEALKRIGGPAWFQLGDEDVATHLARTQMLGEGRTLSAATRALATAYGVRHRIVPMSDMPVRTMVHTDEGVLEFQRYFVARRCEPVVRSIEYAGAAEASPSADFDAALAAPSLRALVVCPSNPYLSIEPLLAMTGMRKRIGLLEVPRIAVSPIIGNAAVKGPAAKIMRELGHEVSSTGIARFYRGLIDALVIHETDAAQAPAIESLGIRVLVTDTLMGTRERQAELAAQVIGFSGRLAAAALA
ncbi:MAG TPA: 2-phospho-L-lactate transferase [Ramlibacter sp.]|nr:2-phospho-L-lactate transferase [Ramlibacter sp.]